MTKLWQECLWQLGKIEKALNSAASLTGGGLQRINDVLQRTQQRMHAIRLVHPRARQIADWRVAKLKELAVVAADWVDYYKHLWMMSSSLAAKRLTALEIRHYKILVELDAGSPQFRY